MNPLKVVFIGTGTIGKELFQALSKHSGIQVPLVVTGQDKPVGRKMELTPNAIKLAALERGVEVLQPENINTPEAVSRLKECSPDVLLVMAYGKILKQEVLDIPTLDCMNVHTSILPRYRGASPIQNTLLSGDEETGVSLMKMVAKMDAGGVYEVYKQPIDADTNGSLSDKLAKLAAKNVPGALLRIASGELSSKEQDESEATYVSKISKADGNIDWSEPGSLIERKVRAFNPWPSCYTFWNGKRLKILESELVGGENDSPGKVLESGICTGSGFILPRTVQIEGKKAQSYSEFINGNQDFIGSTLGSS